MFALALSILLTQTPSSPTQKIDVAKQGWDLASKNYGAGSITIEQVATWSTRLYEAEKSDPAAAQRHLERLRELEKRAQERFNQGMATKLETLTVSYLRLQAEELLQKK
jgi:hypothetical protein